MRGEYDDIRRTYDSMLDWRNSEGLRSKASVEEFATDEGFEWCDDCDYFTNADFWVNGRCPSCRMNEEEAT